MSVSFGSEKNAIYYEPSEDSCHSNERSVHRDSASAENTDRTSVLDPGINSIINKYTKLEKRIKKLKDEKILIISRSKDLNSAFQRSRLTRNPVLSQLEHKRCTIEEDIKALEEENRQLSDTTEKDKDLKIKINERVIALNRTQLSDIEQREISILSQFVDTKIKNITAEIRELRNEQKKLFLSFFFQDKEIRDPHFTAFDQKILELQREIVRLRKLSPKMSDNEPASYGETVTNNERKIRLYSEQKNELELVKSKAIFLSKVIKLRNIKEEIEDLKEEEEELIMDMLSKYNELNDPRLEEIKEKIDTFRKKIDELRTREGSSSDSDEKDLIVRTGEFYIGLYRQHINELKECRSDIISSKKSKFEQCEIQSVINKIRELLAEEKNEYGIVIERMLNEIPLLKHQTKDTLEDILRKIVQIEGKIAKLSAIEEKISQEVNTHVIDIHNPKVKALNKASMECLLNIYNHLILHEDGIFDFEELQQVKLLEEKRFKLEKERADFLKKIEDPEFVFIHHDVDDLRRNIIHFQEMIDRSKDEEEINIYRSNIVLLEEKIAGNIQQYRDVKLKNIDDEIKDTKDEEEYILRRFFSLKVFSRPKWIRLLDNNISTCRENIRTLKGIEESLLSTDDNDRDFRIINIENEIHKNLNNIIVLKKFKIDFLAKYHELKLNHLDEEIRDLKQEKVELVRDFFSLDDDLQHSSDRALYFILKRYRAIIKELREKEDELIDGDLIIFNEDEIERYRLKIRTLEKEEKEENKDRKRKKELEDLENIEELTIAYKKFLEESGKNDELDAFNQLEERIWRLEKKKAEIQRGETQLEVDITNPIVEVLPSHTINFLTQLIAGLEL